MAPISLDDNCKSHWEADEPEICGLPPVRIVLGRKDDNVSFLEAHQDHQRGKKWMHHYVCYHLKKPSVVAYTLRELLYSPFFVEECAEQAYAEEYEEGVLRYAGN